MKRILMATLFMGSMTANSAHALDFTLSPGSYISGGKVNVSFSIVLFTF